MGKKFFDIVPIQKKQEKNIFESEKKPVLKKNNKIIFYSLIGLLTVLLFGLFIHSFSSPLIIEIYPEMNLLEIEEVINLDPKIENSIYATNTIAVKEITVSVKNSQEFLATGKILKQEKALGTIRVYNNHSTESQSLLPETRFVSADGMLFRSVQREIIPGGTYKEGKLVEGYLDIEVIAAEPGPEYNIGPTTFSIPGFAGTAKYTTFYAKSFEPMKGGISQEVSQVKQEDLNQAEEQLLDRMKKEAKEKLLEKVSADFSLIEPIIKYEALEISYSVPAETTQDSFILEIEIQANGFIFKKSEMQEFIKKIASKELEGNLIKPGSLKTNYENGTELKTFFSLMIYPEIDILELKKSIISLTKPQTIFTLQEREEIFKAIIKSWSFLRKRVPENLEKIEMIIKVD
ncbi:MAG: hypothetical protein PHN37_00535 [Candidatus Pacebacteria bacterium]|nr:hypothetical protein [Candidatus Paceibacterota bacterium]